MEEYQFSEKWIKIAELPLSGTRVLITDGEIVIFGTYVTGNWLLEGINTKIPFEIIGWMPCPKPMPKKEVYPDEN